MVTFYSADINKSRVIPCKSPIKLDKNEREDLKKNHVKEIVSVMSNKNDIQILCNKTQLSHTIQISFVSIFRFNMKHIIVKHKFMFHYRIT